MLEADAVTVTSAHILAQLPVKKNNSVFVPNVEVLTLTSAV